MKKLGFGLMRLPLKDPKDQTNIDIEKLSAMADEFIKRGFTYFDTAFPYHQGCSETAFREAVVKRYPRNAYTVADKMPPWQLTSTEDLESTFRVQLERCGVEYFDYYLLHNLGVANLATFEKYGGFDFIKSLKADGRAKTIGFSFHDKPSLLDEILTKYTFFEFVQLQVNYLDWEDPTNESRRCVEVARKHNMPIIVMEPVKGGYLVNLPEEAAAVLKDYNKDASLASWAIRYAAGVPGVFMVLSGMSDTDQMNDNLNTMQDFKPLSDEEKAVLDKTVEAIKSKNTVPCTSCRYCVDTCPSNIAIPSYFSVYNGAKMFGKQFNHYFSFSVLAQSYGKPSDCVECGACMEHCPQRINIIDTLKLVKDEFEKDPPEL
ncbi:MAG: aldo/keto reductase [Abditibacteriota bacterium]|nr:aldo/keto reductase [Abditibacteriota bacterium]MBP5738880.1 aldo/keto reductase [Abditibacteriota bacterium]